MTASMPEPLLRMSGIEAVYISKTFGKTALNGADIDAERFRTIREESDIFHIAVHGNFDTNSPTLSSISLKQRLRVLEILQHHQGHSKLSASLMVFAACVSGLREIASGNDVLGFSHAVLETGCSAFLGSLWEVNDLASMLLMTQSTDSCKTTTREHRWPLYFRKRRSHYMKWVLNSALMLFPLFSRSSPRKSWTTKMQTSSF